MQTRKLNIEFLRIVAIFMTITIHVSNNYIRAFDQITQNEFFVSVVYNSFSRVCVPLFFMIGGMFFVKKEYDGKKHLARIGKFVFILVVWSIIYYLANNGFKFSGILKTIVNSFFNADMTSKHLWYMYPLIGIYIALPFIQNMCKNLSQKQEKLFLILWFCISGLSVIYVPVSRCITDTNINVEYPVPIINSAYYLGYFVSGHILYNQFKDKVFGKKKNIICALTYVAAILVTVAITYGFSIKNEKFFDAATWYRGAFIITATFAVFILAVLNEEKFKNPIILTFSKHTLGIYLIHILFLNIIKKHIDIIQLNPIMAIPVITIILYVVSWLSCVVLSKIPIIKKIIS